MFDVDLARAKNNENPVYYVQYAHARICSVLRTVTDKTQEQVKAQSLAMQCSETTALTAWSVADAARVTLSSLDSAPAQALMMLLAKYPQMLTQACADLAPHDVTFYLRDLAACYHSYYDAERILVDADLKQARVALVAATAQVLSNGLALLGVASPQSM